MGGSGIPAAGTASPAAAAGGGGGGAVEEAQQLHRDGHDEGAVLLGGDLDHGLQQPQLQGGWVGGHHGGRLREFL